MNVAELIQKVIDAFNSRNWFALVIATAELVATLGKLLPSNAPQPMVAFDDVSDDEVVQKLESMKAQELSVGTIMTIISIAMEILKRFAK